MAIEFDGYRPGALADIVGMHARYYAQDWNFGLAFETKVATELSEFLRRADADRDLMLAAYLDGRAIGSVVIDASEVDGEGAHLRWFIVDAVARGTGVGKALIERAIEHCDSRGYELIWLTTFAGLESARAVYDRYGFDLVSESDVDQWSGGVREQRFERRRKPGTPDAS